MQNKFICQCKRRKCKNETNSAFYVMVLQPQLNGRTIGHSLEAFTKSIVYSPRTSQTAAITLRVKSSGYM